MAWFIRVLPPMLVACSAFCAGLPDLLTEAESADMPRYKELRDQVVALGPEVLPELDRMLTNSSASWKRSLVAGICAERIRRGAEIQDMVGKDWTKEPEFDPAWTRFNGGVRMSTDFAALMLSRYKSTHLWYYHLELIWKDTGDYSDKPRMLPISWRDRSKKALLSSPHVDLLARVLEERILKGMGKGIYLGFGSFETQLEFHFLIDNNLRSSIPFILEILPKVPLSDSQREDIMYKMLRETARPEDGILFERYFTDKGQEVPLMLRDSVQGLKGNASKRESKD